MINKSKLSSKNTQRLTSLKKKLALPFILLSLASLVVVQVTPLLVKNGNSAHQPALWQIGSVGVVVIILSALFLTYAAKIIGLTRGWLVLAVLFSSLIVITKFILIPQLLYSKVYVIGNGIGAFDPNNSFGYVSVAIVLFIFYSLILWYAYKYYRDTFVINLGKKPVESNAARKFVITLLVVVAILALLSTVSSAGALLLLPILLFGSAPSYIGYALTNGGIPLFLSTILAIILSVKYLEHSANIAIETKDGAVLAISFWIGFSLLLVYHILWVIYMTAMLTIWPFKTISPSGK